MLWFKCALISYLCWVRNRTLSKNWTTHLVLHLLFEVCAIFWGGKKKFFVPFLPTYYPAACTYACLPRIQIMGHIPTRHLLTACFVKLWAREILFPQMYLCRMIFCFGLFLFLTNFAVKMHTASQPASQPAPGNKLSKSFFFKKR